MRIIILLTKEDVLVSVQMAHKNVYRLFIMNKAGKGFSLNYILLRKINKP